MTSYLFLLKVSLRHRRNKAVFVITLAWLVPLAFSVAGLFSSCIDHCDCVYANYDDVDYCQTSEKLNSKNIN